MAGEKKSISELFNELNYDTKMKESTDLAEKVVKAIGSKTSGVLDVTLNVSVEKFIEHVRDNIKLFSEIEQLENYKPQSATVKELELVLRFLDYGITLKESESITNTSSQIICGDHYKSLFEIIYEVFSYLMVGFESLTIDFDKRRHVLLSELFKIFPKKFSSSKANGSPSYIPNSSTMIIFDSSDIDSATDVLATAWENNSVPWKIRNVLVQESISETFIKTIENKIRSFDSIVLKDPVFIELLQGSLNSASKMGFTILQNEHDKNVLKPLIVMGPNRKYFDKDDSQMMSPIILMNTFRTAKEAVALSKSTSRSGSASIWTENISLAYEVLSSLDVSTVWINNFGYFDPNVPFDFGGFRNTYGLKFGIYRNSLTTLTINDKAAKLVEEDISFIDSKSRTDFSMSKIIGTTNVQCYSMRYLTNVTTIGTKVPYLNNAYIAFNGKHKGFDQSTVYNLLQNKLKTVVLTFGASFAN